MKSFEYKSKVNFILFKYNDGLNDQPGIEEESWKNHLGIYELSSYGLKYYYGLGQFNGYLCLYMNDNWKLEKYQENLYFTADGENIILRDNKIVYRNITLTKSDFDIDKLLKDCSSAKIERDAYKEIFSSVSGILYWSKGFETAYNFILKTINIDNIYQELLSNLGIRLYCYRKLDHAKQCFEKLVELDENNEKTKKWLETIVEEQKINKV
ncbi:MAG TPA: hypothetical protein VMZ29_13080 [Candidatus Bathyarchaeia archaeon]|nr:hypothetical protein [Candidatus Bathyarchaeia archaeon]